MRPGSGLHEPPAMIDQTLLDILVCPETKQPLHVADAELVGKVNGAIEAGTVKNRGGDAVTEVYTAPENTC